MKPRLSIRRARVFAEGLDHPECVTVAGDGTIWAGGEAGQIYRLSADGREVEEVACTGGFLLGVAISPDQSWLAACDLKKQCLWRLDLKSGKLEEFSRGAGAERFGVPNHLAFARDGRLFVTDSSSAQGDSDNPGNSGNSGRIFQYDPDGTGRIWHPGPFKFANGIALSIDEDALFVVSSLLPGVERVPLRPDGTAGRRRIVARLPRTVPDGVALGADGTLYVSCYTPNRIYGISPSGEVGILIDDWFAHTLSNPTNIVFAGPKFDRLLVANLGRWHITEIDFRRRGHPLASQR